MPVLRGSNNVLIYYNSSYKNSNTVKVYRDVNFWVRNLDKFFGLAYFLILRVFMGPDTTSRFYVPFIIGLIIGVVGINIAIHRYQLKGSYWEDLSTIDGCRKLLDVLDRSNYYNIPLMSDLARAGQIEEVVDRFLKPAIVAGNGGKET